MGRDIRQRDRLQPLREDRRGPRGRGSDPAYRLSADRQELSGLSQWLRTYGAVALRLLIAGTLLTLLFTVIPFSEVLHALGGANVLYVLIGLSLQVVLRFVGALRVRILTGPQGISLSALRIFEISCASTFYGLLLPGDLAGGVVRWYKLSRPDSKPTEVLVVMVVDRILDTILLILIGVVFWAIDARLTVAAPRVFLTLGGTVAVLLLITAAILDRRLSRFWIRLAGSRRVPRILRTGLQRTPRCRHGT